MRPSTPAFHDELEKIALNAQAKYRLAQQAVKRMLPGQRVGTNLGSDWRWLGTMESKGKAPSLAKPSPRFLSESRAAVDDLVEVGQAQVPGGAPHVFRGTEGVVEFPGRARILSRQLAPLAPATKYERGSVTPTKEYRKFRDARDAKMEWAAAGPKRQTIHSHPYAQEELAWMPEFNAERLRPTLKKARNYPDPPYSRLGAKERIKRQRLEHDKANRLMDPHVSVAPSHDDLDVSGFGGERGMWHGIVDPVEGVMGHHRVAGRSRGGHQPAAERARQRRLTTFLEDYEKMQRPSRGEA